MQFDQLKRREFITLIGGAACLPLAARAQQPDRMRRVGVLLTVNEDDRDRQANLVAFAQALRQLGWVESRNLQIETRWAGGDPAAIRRHAEQLVALAPDVIVAAGNSAMPPLLQATRTLPIVFNNVIDPVGAGFSMAQPGGNATGFILFEYSLSAKWLGLLKELAPNLTRVAVLRDSAISAGVGQFAVIQSVAPSVGVDVKAINVRDASEIEYAVTSFARVPNSGLILTASALAIVHRELIIALAAKHKLPAVYYRHYFVASGGLASYGYDVVQQFIGAAEYVSRILKGAKPADLPVQAPTKYETVLNLKTAKALGLTVPESVLARADEVIE
jgi:putative ABC transport system substrate-binding protein